MTDITMHSMFERFSSGYYLGNCTWNPTAASGPSSSGSTTSTSTSSYTLTAGVERLDAPLVMKVGGGHIPVSGDDDVPSGTLAIPHEIADDTLPDRRNVLLADADRAETLLRWEGWEPFANA